MSNLPIVLAIGSPMIGAIPRSETRPVERKYEAIVVEDKSIVIVRRYHVRRSKISECKRSTGIPPLYLRIEIEAECCRLNPLESSMKDSAIIDVQMFAWKVRAVRRTADDSVTVLRM